MAGTTYRNRLTLPLRLDRNTATDMWEIVDATGAALAFVPADEDCAAIEQILYEVNRRQVLRATCRDMRAERRREGRCIVCGRPAAVNARTDRPYQHCGRHREKHAAGLRRRQARSGGAVRP